MRLAFSCAAALLLLIPTTAMPLHADELITDDVATNVQFTGDWATSTTSPGFQGNGYRYRVAGSGANQVRWPFPTSAGAGSYEVSARWTSGENRASNASYVVTHAGGTSSVTVDQRTNGGTWRSLGTFNFSADANQGVTLSDKANGVVIADAIRWLPAGSAGSATPAASATTADERFFEQTQFRVDRDAFWDFFQRRGGIRTFGYPVSREFTLFGCTTQLFQRIAMQQCGDQGVGTLNLLDEGLLPFTRFSGATVPGPDPALIQGAPLPTDPNYGTKAIEFVRANAADTFEGESVGFLKTFLSTVSAADAFPRGGDEGLLPLLNLQLWGLPTSKPAIDPNNHEFIYQRFQRGVMHYDRGCKCTQGLLLADYLKAVLTGDRLPADLAAQAAGSQLLRAAVNGQALRASSFVDAFTAQSPRVVVAAPATQPAPASAPAPAILPTPAIAAVSSPDFGMSMFLWGHSATTDRDLKLVTDAGFRWQKTLFQWRQIEGACKGCFDWTESDRVVKASGQAGVKIIARIDFQPTWARRDGAPNGPPDNYQDYADFITAFVKRYSSSSTVGRVHAVEVWNEVNLDREWGGQAINPQQAKDYVQLLGLAYRAAKAADPFVTVITAGLSPTGVTDGRAADDVQYLQWLFDAGMKGGVNYDVLGAHGNTQAPEVDAAFGSLTNFPHASFYFRRVEQLREVQVRNGDADRQIWLLEFGWTADKVHPNYAWFAVSEDKKAANIVRAFEYAQQNWQPWIGVMTLWTLPDPNWTTDREEYWWAITNADGSARPAYAELVRLKRGGILPFPG